MHILNQRLYFYPLHGVRYDKPVSRRAPTPHTNFSFQRPIPQEALLSGLLPLEAFPDYGWLVENRPPRPHSWV